MWQNWIELDNEYTNEESRDSNKNKSIRIVYNFLKENGRID